MATEQKQAIGQIAKGHHGDEEGMAMAAQPTVPTASQFLRDRAALLRQRADQLEAFADSLPAKLPPDAAKGFFQIMRHTPIV